MNTKIGLQSELNVKTKSATGNVEILFDFSERRP